MEKHKIMLTEAQATILLEKADWTKADIERAVSAAIKSNNDVKKDLEKKVKEIVAKSVNTLFRTLWQRHNFYEDEIRR